MTNAPDQTKKRKEKKKGGGTAGFAIAAVVLSIIVIPFMYYSLSMYFLARKIRPDYEWPELSELWKTAVSGVIFILLKKFTIYATYDLNKRICKDQDKPEMLDLRAKKASK